MTNKTISALSSASTIVGTEVLPIVQSSATVKVSVANLTSGLGTIIATKGGTGQTSYSVGDIIYSDTITTLAKLGIGAANYVLTSSGTVPQYVAQSTLSVGSATNATNVGTTDNTSSSSTYYPTLVSATSGNNPITTSSTKLSFVPSTGKLTATSYGGAWAGSTIGTGYGGTGLTSFTANGIVYASSTSVLATSSVFTYDGSGNLLVGTTNTNPAASGVNGTVILANGGIRNSNGGSASYLGITTSSGTQLSFYTYSSGAVLAGSITNPTSTTTAYTSVSDYRLKENIAPMKGALSVVNQLNPCTYDWIIDKSKGQGFIAHELQTLIPDCVIGEKDAVDEEGKPQYQSIDTSFLVATLTSAIQELSAQVTALQAKVGS